MSHNISQLIDKLLAGQCTDKEINILSEYFKENSFNEIEPLLKEEWNNPDTNNISSEKKELLLQNIKRQIEAERESRFEINSFLKYAAVFIGLIGISFWFFSPGSQEVVSPEITLELEDGSIKTLDSEEALITETDFTYKEGKLLYTPKEAPSEEKLEFNTIRVPLGKSIILVLSDGSETTLNAGSSLKYPKAFLEGKGREVYLEGEAYFEVVSNPEEPFKVISDHTTTQVLGTKFNISAYPGDKNENIVLIEGSVEVSAKNSEIKNILKPNEIARFRKSNKSISVSEVNALDHIAWTEGVMLFRNEKFSDIMPKLERHYNITIEYKDEVLSRQSFTGRFKNESIEDVFKTFQRAAEFNYNIKKDKIIINSKK